MPTSSVALTTAWVLIATAAAGVKVKPDLGSDVLLSVNATLPASDTTAISFSPEAGGWMTLSDLGSSNVYARAVAGTANLRVIPMAGASLGTSSSLIGHIDGAVAHDAVLSGNPVRIGARGMSANFAAVASGDVVDLAATLVGAQVVRPFSIPELEWQATGTKADLTDLVVKAAVAGNKNYMTGLQYHNTSAVASDIVVKQGATVIWTGRAPASMLVPAVITFPTPLQSAVNAALNVALLTTATATTINAQGFTAP